MKIKKNSKRHPDRFIGIFVGSGSSECCHLPVKEQRWPERRISWSMQEHASTNLIHETMDSKCTNLSRGLLSHWLYSKLYLLASFSHPLLLNWSLCSRILWSRLLARSLTQSPANGERIEYLKFTNLDAPRRESQSMFHKVIRYHVNHMVRRRSGSEEFPPFFSFSYYTVAGLHDNTTSAPPLEHISLHAWAVIAVNIECLSSSSRS